MNHDFTLCYEKWLYFIWKTVFTWMRRLDHKCCSVISHCSKNCYRCSPQQLIRLTFEYIRRSTSAAAAFTASRYTENLDANHAFTRIIFPAHFHFIKLSIVILNSMKNRRETMPSSQYILSYFYCDIMDLCFRLS